MPRQTGYEPLAQFLRMRPGPGETPSSIAVNDYLAGIPHTPEQQRQAGVIAGRDARIDASLDAQRAQVATEEAAQQAGFRNAAEAAAWQREQAERELEIPLEQARIQGETAATAQQGIADRMMATQQAIADRQERSQAATAARQADTQGAIAARQRATQAEIRARGIESDPSRATIPPAQGPIQHLQRFFGLGQFDPRAAAQSEAGRVRQEALQGVAGGADMAGGDADPSGVQAVAQEILSDNPGASLEELQQIVLEQVTGGSPEELEALMSTLIGMRGTR